MPDIASIIDFTSRKTSDIIADLKQKSVKVTDWSKLLKDYEPTKHKIVSDTTSLKDKIRSDGTLEPSARITIGLEKLLVKRISEFTFAIPVKRVYTNTENNQTRLDIAKALEAIYKNARIDAENLKRGVSYYAACEVFTLWYAVKKPNTLYGFESEYKLKCKTYSPMDGTRLYPLFDELGDMLAMSFEYTKTIGKQTTTYFETYTADRHYIWKQDLQGGEWTVVTAKVSDDGETVNGEEIIILKIPGVYACRPVPVYHGLTGLRSEIEYTLSRNSNVIAYNSAPVLKISGGIKGQEDKGEARRIFRVENGGDVAYVSWQQAIEALKYHVDTMLKLYWMQAQIPDISFENMKGLGNIGFDARQTMLTDAHLKIGDEAGTWIEFLERECNVIKAFLKAMCQKSHKNWLNEIDNVSVEHVITPFIQNDELSEINKRMKANGGKPIESHLESIQKYGQSDDAQATLDQINKEEEQSAQTKASAFSMSNSMI
ncbi:MAG: phage portal protein [Bacteroidaceae bacterium]|nr:phage portal protein [Bacteroidaceae bacterium]